MKEILLINVHAFQTLLLNYRNKIDTLAILPLVSLYNEDALRCRTLAAY